MKQLGKLPSLIKINLKNMASNRVALISMAVFTILLGFVCSGLIADYEEKSSIPVGILDLDQSTLSQSVTDNLSDLDSITLLYGTEAELKKSLKEDRIYAYFVIYKGFETAINQYKFSKLVEMVYLGQNQYVSILSDVFNQAMIQDIIVKEGERLYQTFPDYENLIYQTDYNEFIQSEYEKKETSFAFQYSFYNTVHGDVQSAKAVSNNIISTELFLALGGIFLVFFVMQLIASMDKKSIVISRTRVSLISKWTMELADFITLIITEGVITILVSWYLIHNLSVDIKNKMVNIIFLITIFMIAITMFFVLLRRVIINIIAYQFTGFIIALALGSISIMEILGQFQIEMVSNLAKKTPNYWFISGITDIILGGKTLSYTDIAYTMSLLLLVYGIIMVIKYKKLEKS